MLILNRQEKVLLTFQPGQTLVKNKIILSDSKKINQCQNFRKNLINKKIKIWDNLSCSLMTVLIK